MTLALRGPPTAWILRWALSSLSQSSVRRTLDLTGPNGVKALLVEAIQRKGDEASGATFVMSSGVASVSLRVTGWADRQHTGAELA
jgi:hypothetical protein